MKKLALGIFSSFVLLSTSCIKEIENTFNDLSSIKGITTNPTIAAPLINATATLKDLIDDFTVDTDISTDADGKIILKFTSTDSVPQKQYINLPGVNFSFDAIMPPTEIPTFEATGRYNQIIANDFAIAISDNKRIERVVVNKGVLTLNVGSSFKHNTVVKVSYPGITKNGKAYSDSFVFIYNGSTPPSIIRNVDLAGYEIDLSKNGTTYNIFTYEIDIDINRNPDNNVGLTDKISLIQNLTVNEYKRIEGYFGKFEIGEIKQTKEIELFDKKLEGNVFVKNPTIKIKITNSFGLPITAKITELYVMSGTGVQTPILINIFKDTFNIDYTTNIDQTRITEYIIDKTNSNIYDVINTAPQYIIYKVLFTANSDNVPKANVISDYTTVKRETYLELPVDIKILNYSIETEGGFELGKSLSDLDSDGVYVNWAETVSDLMNELPLNAQIQIYIDDSVTNKVIDSVYNPAYIIPAASVNSFGEVTQPTRAKVSNMITRAHYEKLIKGNRYRLQIRLKTPETSTGVFPFFSFYDFQKIHVKLGVRTNINLRK